MEFFSHSKKIISFDYYIFYVALFALPFGKKFFLPVQFIWLCIVFISYFFVKDYSKERFKGLLILPIIFFLIHIISVVLSPNLKENLFDLQFKLLLLLFPLLYPFQRESYKNRSQSFLLTFLIGCIVATIYYIGYAFYRSYTLVDGFWIFNPISQSGLNNYFFNTEFSYLIHPSYLALYILVALLIMGCSFSRWWTNNIFVKSIMILSSLFLIISLILLQSRVGILCFVLLTLFFFSILVFGKRKFILGVILILVMITITIFVLNKFDRFSNTYQSLLETTEIGIKNQNKEDGALVRFWIWKSSLSIIKEHPVLGIGTMNVRNELQKKYKNKGMIDAAQNRFNAHNQYLETWLSVGVFGLFALLVMLFVPLWVGIKKRDWLIVGFICLCSVSFIFESMFERIAGITFFSIFYSILVSSIINDNSSKEIKIE